VPVRQMRQHLDRAAMRRSPQGHNAPKGVMSQSCCSNPLLNLSIAVTSGESYINLIVPGSTPKGVPAF